ncbi:MAG: CHASE2 domain-containing protein [Bdellovibrionales bacterium]|nr:CHASE2 domain-containing protein [Bdellovibrionales bacterium]
MTQLKNWLRQTLPTLTVGALLTLCVCGLALLYYPVRSLPDMENEGFLLKLIRLSDRKALDIRFENRGPRAGSEQVALLTVDEKAVRSVGRWPWPRKLVADAISEALDLGAKTVAFDMVFAEPTQCSEKNDDAAFAKMVKNYSDRVILGTAASDTLSQLRLPPHTAYCRNLIYELSPAFKTWDNDQEIISVLDENEVYIPYQIGDELKKHLEQIKDDVLHQRASLDIVDHHDALMAATAAQEDYCFTRWLTENDELTSMFESLWPQLKAEDEDFQATSYKSWGEHLKSKTLNNSVDDSFDWIMNIPSFSEKALHQGFFNTVLDIDGTIRESQLISRSGHHYMPSIALKSFLVGNHYNAEITLTTHPHDLTTSHISELRITNLDTGKVATTLPIASQGRLIINYAGGHKMFPHASLADLLTAKPTMTVSQRLFDERSNQWIVRDLEVNKKDFIKDKYFIIGATAKGIYDLRVTPFEKDYPGAETHANIIDNLLRGDFLRYHPDEFKYMIGFLLMFGLLLTLILSISGAITGVVIGITAFLGILFVDRNWLYANGYVVSTIFPLFMITTQYVGLTFFRYFTEERKKRELRSTFSKYVSPAIVNEILKDPVNLELGGRKENITVFFSDIRGFTSISEKLDPQELSDLLNSYLTPMTELVFENRGTIDKYMGDAIMAFFGAPIHYPDHASQACRCALAHIEKLKVLQEDCKQRGLPVIDIGIGLNTGECSVGNMGSKTIRNYTVMGDSVNLGSRLEGINKQYGTRIIISEFTHQAISTTFICREVDWVRVKGKAQPVKIFELCGENTVEKTLQTTLLHFEEGYKYYHQRNFDKALKSFEEAARISPEDGPTRLYIQRCHSFQEAPPPPQWDGVYEMKTK